MVATPIATPWPTSEPGMAVAEAPQPHPTTLSIAPDGGLLFVTLPGIAGLAVLGGAMILGTVLKRWQGREPQSKAVRRTREGRGPELPGRKQGEDPQLWDQGISDDAGDAWPQTARRRYALLAVAIWFSLSIYLVLDASFAVSVYWQVAAIYAAFWILIGALLLVGSPRREKLLILGLLVVALLSVRFVDWNSRKPFLKDLYRVQEGMTVEQVEQIMGHHMVGSGWPADPLGLPTRSAVAGTEDLTQPDRLVYRHTNEGWGNSDWGEIRFQEGRVVEIRFLPD
jgi:hypothetical protein